MATFPEEKRSEDWTGEPDAVAAIALAVCLAVAALIFLVVAVVELSR
jgi:hypothetical protein